MPYPYRREAYTTKQDATFPAAEKLDACQQSRHREVLQGRDVCLGQQSAGGDNPTQILDEARDQSRMMDDCFHATTNSHGLAQPTPELLFETTCDKESTLPHICNENALNDEAPKDP
jgi:hypothetical protein